MFRNTIITVKAKAFLINQLGSVLLTRWLKSVESAVQRLKAFRFIRCRTFRGVAFCCFNKEVGAKLGLPFHCPMKRASERGHFAYSGLIFYRKKHGLLPSS